MIGVELLAPGIFLIWLGLAALAHRVARRGVRPVLADLDASLRALSVVSGPPRPVRQRGPRRRTDRCRALNRRGEALVGRIFTLEAPIKDGEGRIRVDDSSWRVTGADRRRRQVVRVDGRRWWSRGERHER